MDNYDAWNHLTSTMSNTYLAVPLRSSSHMIFYSFAVCVHHNFVDHQGAKDLVFYESVAGNTSNLVSEDTTVRFFSLRFDKPQALIHPVFSSKCKGYRRIRVSLITVGVNA